MSGRDPGYSCRVGLYKDLRNLIGMASFKVASFNCRGLRSSEDLVTELFQEANVLTLREHCLNPAEFKVLSSV